MNTAIFITLCIVSSLSYLQAEPVAEIQTPRGPGIVYVLRQATTNFYKIGLTTGTVAKRIKQLQTGNPQEIKEVYSHAKSIRCAQS